MIPPEHIGLRSGGMCAVYLHFGAPFEQRWIYLYRQSQQWYHPTEDDGQQIYAMWSQTDRDVQAQVNNQVTAFEYKFSLAGRAVKAGDYNEAAKQYASAIFQALRRFKGLYYNDPDMLTEVRSHLPELKDIPLEDKVAIITEVCRRLYDEKPTDEMKNVSFSKERLVRFGFSVMLSWLVVKELDQKVS